MIPEQPEIFVILFKYSPKSPSQVIGAALDYETARVVAMAWAEQRGWEEHARRLALKTAWHPAPSETKWSTPAGEVVGMAYLRSEDVTYSVLRLPLHGAEAGTEGHDESGPVIKQGKDD